MPLTPPTIQTQSSIHAHHSASHTQFKDTQRNNLESQTTPRSVMRASGKASSLSYMDLTRLPIAALTVLGQHLSPRDIGRLALTCKQMRHIGQRWVAHLTELQVARHIAQNKAAQLNAQPVVCVRPTGRHAELLASALEPAPWVNRLDLRELENASAIDIISLATSHPNAQIALTQAQLNLLLSHYLRRATALEKTYPRDAPPGHQSDMPSDPFGQLVNSMPKNLVRPCALAASTTVRDPRRNTFPPTTAAIVRHPPRCWSSDSLSRLAVALLARSEREIEMPRPTRLLLATEAIRTFPWHTPVSKHQRLLLLSKVAYALSQGQIADAFVVRPLLICLGRAIELEASLRKASYKPSWDDATGDTHCLAPEDVLKTMLNWGANPYVCDHNGLTAIEQLKQRFGNAPAEALHDAINDIQNHKASQLRLERSARRLNRALCVQS